MRANLVLPLLAFLVLIVICLTAACNHESATVTEITAVEQPSKKEATFEVGMLAISPATPMVDDTLSISAAVKNSGDIAGTYTAILTIDEQEFAREQAVVAPASSSTVVLQVANLPLGEHTIGIGESYSSVTIHDWAPYTIKYCRGQSDWALFTGDTGTPRGSGDLGQIVNFILPASPLKIQQIWINGEVTTENPQELDNRQFTVTIWSQDRSQQLWSEDFPWRIFDNRMRWRAVDVPDIRVEDDFYVEVVTRSDPGNGAKNYLHIASEIARDALPEPRSLEYYRKSAFDSHSGWSVNGQPSKPPGREISLNWCIRVDGLGKR